MINKFIFNQIMRESSVKSKNSICTFVNKLVALKSLVLSLSNTSPELLIDQKRFLRDFTVLNNMF